MTFGFEAYTADGKVSIDGESPQLTLFHEANIHLSAPTGIHSSQWVMFPSSTTKPLMCLLHVENGYMKLEHYWVQSGGRVIGALVWGLQGSRGKGWWYTV